MFMLSQEYSLHFTFREEWIDERLRFSDRRVPYINLSPGTRDHFLFIIKYKYIFHVQYALYYFYTGTVRYIVGQKIWMPDTFFQNEKDGKKHDIDTPNVLLRVYNSTGKILYSVRYVWKIFDI